MGWFNVLASPPVWLSPPSPLTALENTLAHPWLLFFDQVRTFHALKYLWDLQPNFSISPILVLRGLNQRLDFTQAKAFHLDIFKTVDYTSFQLSHSNEVDLNSQTFSFPTKLHFLARLVVSKTILAQFYAGQREIRKGDMEQGGNSSQGFVGRAQATNSACRRTKLITVQLGANVKCKRFSWLSNNPRQGCFFKES